MTVHCHAAHHPRQEHSVPWFWPMAAAIEFGEEGIKLFQDNLRYVAEVEEIAEPPAPKWATSNRVVLDLDTMRLRDFSVAGHQHPQTPVLIDAPYGGRSSTIADYAIGQSLVETLQAGGLEHVLVADWKTVTEPMKNFDIDKYLTDINTAVDYLGRMVDLIGLCQAGLTTTEQVFDAEKYLGASKSEIIEKLLPGGYIGLCVGANTLTEC